MKSLCYTGHSEATQQNCPRPYSIDGLRLTLKTAAICCCVSGQPAARSRCSSARPWQWPRCPHDFSRHWSENKLINKYRYAHSLALSIYLSISIYPSINCTHIYPVYLIIQSGEVASTPAMVAPFLAEALMRTTSTSPTRPDVMLYYIILHYYIILN